MSGQSASRLSARIGINQTPRLQELWLTFPALTKAGGSEAVFVTGIYAPLQKLFALRRGFRPDFFDKRRTKNIKSPYNPRQYRTAVSISCIFSSDSFPTGAEGKFENQERLFLKEAHFHQSKREH